MNKRYLLIVCLIIVASILSGCVYYNLLKLKWQLANFEDNFKLEDKKGLTVILKNPVLTKSDIKWLMNNEATKILDDPATQNTWMYILTKKDNPGIHEETNYDIEILMEFKNEKLTEATLPKRFLENLSKEMLAKLFKSVGKSKVDKKKRQAGSVVEGSKKGIPTIYDILHTLGKPFLRKDENDIIKLRYIYNLDNPGNNYDIKPFYLNFDFELNNEDKVLRKSSININGLKLTTNFLLEGGN